MTDRPLSEIVEDIKRLAHELASYTAVPATVVASPSNQKKLTKREVQHIRELKRNGFNNTEIADIYDVHRVTIYRICKGVYHR